MLYAGQGLGPNVPEAPGGLLGVGGQQNPRKPRGGGGDSISRDHDFPPPPETTFRRRLPYHKHVRDACMSVMRCSQYGMYSPPKGMCIQACHRPLFPLFALGFGLASGIDLTLPYPIRSKRLTAPCIEAPPSPEVADQNTIKPLLGDH